MGVDGERVVGGVEHLDERDEVKEDAGERGGNTKVTPAGAVVEGRGQNREGGDAIEKNREPEPEEGHCRQTPVYRAGGLTRIRGDERGSGRISARIKDDQR